MDKDTLIAVNGNSLLFNTGVAYIAEQNLSERQERVFELPVKSEEKSDELEEKLPAKGGKLSARLTPAYIHTVEQFLVFRNITLNQ